MQQTLKTLRNKIVLLVTAFVLVTSSSMTVAPFLFTQTASAISASNTIYDALPDVSVPTNYASVGYQATSMSEFGDAIHLADANRTLDTVTATLSDWAKYSTYSSNPTYAANTATWSHDITLNIYSSHLGANGAPDTLLRTTTQNFDIPWRPESDPTCGSTSNGAGWKVGATCYNFSGLSSNIVFDVSSLNIVAPSDIIVGIAYNTQTRGYAPIGAPGPYDSLNLAVPDGQVVSVGSDVSADEVFQNTSHGPFYTDGGAAGVGIFRKDTAWSPYGTVALKVTAQALSAPTIVAPANNSYTTNPSFDNIFTKVAGAATYQYETTYNNGANSYADTSASSNYDLSGTNVVRHNNGAPEATYKWRVRAVDAVGNPGAWSDYSYVTVDKTVPTTPSLTYPTNNGYLTGNNFYFDWTDATDATPLTYEFQSSQSSTTSSGVLTNGVWNNIAHGAPDRNNLTTSTIHSSGANGTWYWQVRAIDAAGNKSAWTPVWKMTIDMQAPTAPVLSAATSGGQSLTSGDVTSSYSIVANWAASSSDIVKYLYKYWNAIPGNPYDAAHPYVVEQAGTTRSGVFNQGEGTHYIQIFAIDAAGNTSAGSNVFAIIYDVTAPVVTIDQASLSGATPTITGTVDDATAEVTVTIDGTDYTATNNGDGTWGYVVTSALASGSHTVNANAADNAGNASLPVNTSFSVASVLGTSTTTGVATSGPITPLALVNVNEPTTSFDQTAADTTETPEVLAAETTVANINDIAAIESATDTETTASDQFLDMAWYWWLLIAAAVVGFIWWMIAARRSRDDT